MKRRRYMQRLKTMRNAAFAVVAAISAGAAAAGYTEFIQDGYPAANPSYSGHSPSMPLESATSARFTPVERMEAGCLTWDESDGISIRTDGIGTFIIFR